MTKTRRKGSVHHQGKSAVNLSNDASSQLQDEYHNYANPCSLGLELICADIFPEFFAQIHTNLEHNTRPKQQQLEDSITLDQAVRYHLLEKRQTQQRLLEQRQLERTDTNEETTALSKKRKKKKKKKKDLEDQPVHDPSSSSPSPIQAVDSIHQDHVPESKQSIDRIDHEDESNLNPPKGKLNDYSLREFQVDAMLDHILLQSKKALSPSAQSESIQTNQKEIVISESRQLHSFLQYLHQRFAKYYQKSTPQHANSIKEKGNRGHPSNKHTAKVLPTNTECTALIDIDHGSFCDTETFTPYPQDLVPTLCLSDISSACSRIKCHSCNVAAFQYVRCWNMNQGNSTNTSPTSSSSSTPLSSRTSSGATRVQDRYTMTDPYDPFGNHPTSSSSSSVLNDASSRQFFIINSDSAQVDEEKSRSSLQVPLSGWSTFTNEYPVDEQAFDYHALEEGIDPTDYIYPVAHHHTTHPIRTAVQDASTNTESEENSFVLLLRILESSESTNGKILQLVPNSKDPPPTGDTAITDFPLSLIEFERWIRSVILPCGLKALDQFKDDAKVLASNTVLDPCLSKEDFHAIGSQVESLSSNLSEKFSSLDQAFKEIHELMGQAEFDVSLGPVCPSASRSLELANSKCMDYFVSVEKFFSCLHRCTMDARIVPNGYSQWIEDIMRQLWGAYEFAMHQLIPVTTDYSRINLPSRTGSTPPICNDPLRRQYYLQMLSEKLKVIDILHDKMGAVLRPRTISTSAQHRSELVRIAVVSLLFTHLRCKEQVDWKLDFHNQYHDLLSHHTAMMFDTVHLMNTQDMLKEQRAKCQKLRESAVSLGDKLVTYDEINVLEIPEKYKSVWVEYLICFDVQKSCFGISDSVLLETKELQYLLELSNNVARLYRVKDLIDRYNSVGSEAKINLSEIPFLPVSNINNIFNALMTLQENTDNSTGKGSGTVFCKGQGGKRRISCIISAFLYQWLSMRYLEFHADVTQSELLSTITQNPTLANTSALVSEVNLSKKLSRKKYKKKTALKTRDINGNANDSNDHEGVEQDENRSDGVVNQDSAPFTVESDSNETVQVHDDDEDDSSVLQINYDGTIGVTDGDTFISARDYLIARYDEILLSSPYVLHL